ncbi:hypothetical protein Poly41_16250 [Novipirellula artificiosorum]|uniref:Uncharacterized protein n=1 Tax=Novipirellula artificiosorum TaxID=2528016 RepID=A0A5C6DVP9_9BACT|nr:hypothetical protein Poly41_16250 [Novipirellula artificiosorum]
MGGLFVLVVDYALQGSHTGRTDDLIARKHQL